MTKASPEARAPAVESTCVTAAAYTNEKSTRMKSNACIVSAIHIAASTINLKLVSEQIPYALDIGKFGEERRNLVTTQRERAFLVAHLKRGAPRSIRSMLDNGTAFALGFAVAPQCINL
jgi:hypothetical protein